MRLFLLALLLGCVTLPLGCDDSHDCDLICRHVEELSGETWDEATLDECLASCDADDVTQARRDCILAAETYPEIWDDCGGF
jgi:hypothetical protein